MVFPQSRVQFTKLTLKILTAVDMLVEGGSLINDKSTGAIDFQSIILQERIHIGI
jgi:hypothetical protein